MNEHAPLSAEDKSTLAYFTLEKSDPTRWVGWESKLPSIVQHAPDFHAAWVAYQRAEAALLAAAQTLQEEADEHG